MSNQYYIFALSLKPKQEMKENKIDKSMGAVDAAALRNFFENNRIFELADMSQLYETRLAALKKSKKNALYINLCFEAALSVIKTKIEEVASRILNKSEMKTLRDEVLQMRINAADSMFDSDMCNYRFQTEKDIEVAIRKIFGMGDAVPKKYQTIGNKFLKIDNGRAKEYADVILLNDGEAVICQSLRNRDGFDVYLPNGNIEKVSTKEDAFNILKNIGF